MDSRSSTWSFVGLRYGMLRMEAQGTRAWRTQQDGGEGGTGSPPVKWGMVPPPAGAGAPVWCRRRWRGVTAAARLGDARGRPGRHLLLQCPHGGGAVGGTGRVTMHGVPRYTVGSGCVRGRRVAPRKGLRATDHRQRSVMPLKPRANRGFTLCLCGVAMQFQVVSSASGPP